jgi:hypothetical protein
MKTCQRFILVLLFMTSVMSGFSQGIDLSLLTGYNFADRFSVQRGEGRLDEGAAYGGIVSFGLDPNYDLELMYLRQDSRVDFDDYFYLSRPITDEKVSVNYIQIGGCRNTNLDPVGKSVFFGGMNVGVVGFNPVSSNYNEIWKFAAGLKAGFKYYFSEKIGMRVQANLQMPVLYTSGSIWVGSGGVDVGMSGGSTITQFGFSGGLVFRLK